MLLSQRCWVTQSLNGKRANTTTTAASLMRIGQQSGNVENSNVVTLDTILKEYVLLFDQSVK